MHIDAIHSNVPKETLLARATAAAQALSNG